MSKYTDMMENAEYFEEESGYPKDAADWRAMREAWEAMVEALHDIATNYDHDNDAHRYGTHCRQCSAEAALTQARTE